MRRLWKNSRTGLKTLLRELGRKAGLEIQLSKSEVRDDLRLVSFLTLSRIGRVLDIGANEGQFAQGLFKAGYRGEIISFEALPDAHGRLSAAVAQSNRAWTVGPRLALSNKCGMAQFHIADADTASSLLVPRQDMIASSPQTRVARTIEVPTARLDDVVKDTKLPVADCFIKMDVQGSEALVMEGAPETLAAAAGLMAELSLTPLYEGQPMAREVLEAICASGFEVWDVWRGYRNPITHRLNQIDVICFKSGVTASRERE